MKHHLIQIKGKAWKIHFVSEKQFEKLTKVEEAEAVTIPSKKEIWFIKKYLCVAVIRHELLHGIVAENNAADSGLDSHQTEEMCASIIGDHYEEIGALTFQIIDFYLKGE